MGAGLDMHVLTGLDCHYAAYTCMTAARDLQVVAGLDVHGTVAGDREVLLGLQHGHAIADHRDLVLSASEKAANNRMLVCCSGSKSRKLVLDL